MVDAHSRKTLTRDLRNLGLIDGDGVFVHASMRSVGRVEGGPASVIEALSDTVGPRGLVGMPGFSNDAYPPEDMNRDALSRGEIARIEFGVPGYDAGRSPTAGMGIVAETFRTWPGTKRSAHPTTSVCLNGHEADAYLTPHDAAWSTGPNSPFGHLAFRPGMKVLLIGVGWNRCTPLHTAETLAAHKRLKMRRFKSGPGAALWFETPDIADDMDRLFPLVGRAFETTGRVTEGRFGNAEARLCGYSDLLDYASRWIDAENERSGVRL